jgi:hypothetical protein
MPDLLPIGTIVKVTERWPTERTYVGKVVGYDLGRSKYHVGARYAPGLYANGGWWPFPSDVEPAGEDT